MKDLPLPVSSETAWLLYTLARGCKARTIIEFGTSFGIWTLHLAAALRDNADGRLDTTEFEASRVARARENVTAGGLIDLLLPDGAKDLYGKIPGLVQSRFRPGAFIVAEASLYKFATCPIELPSVQGKFSRSYGW